MPTWVYILDSFKLIDVDIDEVLRLAEDNPLELFNKYIKGIVEEELGSITSIELCNIYFNPKEFELLIEYIVKCRLGEVSVKVIHSKDPRSTLMRYYKYERRKAK